MELIFTSWSFFKGYTEKKVFRNTGIAVKAAEDWEKYTALMGLSKGKAKKRDGSNNCLILSFVRAAGGFSDAFSYSCVQTAAETWKLEIRSPGDIGLLYGVYDFLENVCGCGFFVDGEQVPEAMCFDPEDAAAEKTPAFRDRFWNSDYGHWSLKKQQSHFWTLDEWKRQIDWMVKRKLNMFNFPLSGSANYAGLIPQQKLLGGGKKEEKAKYQPAGYPNGWGYADEYQHELNKRIITYARSLGIRIVYALSYAVVPTEFKEVHPDFDYISDGYGNVVLDPRNTRVKSLFLDYFSALIEEYGTDHLYHCSAFGETEVLDDPEESFRIKMRITEDVISLLHELDPDMRYVYDSWDYACFPDSSWKKENIIQHLDSLPEGSYIYETAFDMWNEFYKKTDYYRGHEWALGFLNSFSRNDEPHGDLGVLHRKVKKALDDPRSDKLKGIFLVPELTNVNILYWHFAAELAYEGIACTPERFTEEFVRKRYGGQKEWGEALALFIQAAHTDYDAAAYEEVVGAGGGRLPAVAYSSGWYNKYYYQVKRLLPADKTGNKTGMRNQYLEKAERMQAMLAIVINLDAANFSRIEENDLVTSMRFFCGMISNTALFNMYFACKAGNGDDFEASASMAVDAVESVYRILSHREEYSLEKMIREVLSVPGTNPYAAEMIKATSVNIDYNANEVYEQIAFYYLPRLYRYIDWLRNKMKSSADSVDLAEFKTGDINNAWIRHPVTVWTSPSQCGNYYEECSRVYRRLEQRLPALKKISLKYGGGQKKRGPYSDDNMWAGTE
jgi:hypothetical protein